MEQFNRSFSSMYANLVGVITILGYIIVFISPFFIPDLDLLPLLGLWIGGFFVWTFACGLHIILVSIWQMMDSQVPVEKKKRKKLQWVEVE